MISQSDLIMIGLAFLIGYLDDIYGPQKYHYQDTIVEVDRKYQCPSYCAVNHNHKVYFNSETGGMIINEEELGKKINQRKK